MLILPWGIGHPPQINDYDSGKAFGQLLGSEALFQVSLIGGTSYLYLAGVCQGIVDGYEWDSTGPYGKACGYLAPCSFQTSELWNTIRCHHMSPRKPARQPQTSAWCNRACLPGKALLLNNRRSEMGK